MKKEKKHNTISLVPELRFPEFRDEGEWVEGTLGDSLVGPPQYGLNAASVPYSDNLPAYLRITDISDEGLFLPEKKVSVDYTPKKEDYLIDGDIVLARTGASVGKSYKYQLKDGELVYAGYLIRIQPNPVKIKSSFLFNYFFTPYYWKWVSIVSSRSGQPGINGSEYASFPISFPSLPEQQKIADCLSSLDELIQFQTKKLEALQSHKKGLLQNLFPAEGETVPRLRFPEFVGTGDWVERKLGEVFENKIEKGENGLPIYSVTMNDGMVKRSSLDRKVDDIENSEGNKKVNKGEIAYNMMRMWQGAFGVANEDCMVSPAYVVISPSEDVFAHFFWYLFKLPIYLKLLTSHSQGLTLDRLRLYYKDFAKIPALIPSHLEQQRIAGCLSSVDVLIQEQLDALEKLKTHKKGLLQGLFPVMGE